MKGLSCSFSKVSSSYQSTEDCVNHFSEQDTDILNSLYVIRCDIPVVIMGETGCGKTCLIRYMCGLQSGPGGPKNMLLMKVWTAQ